MKWNELKKIAIKKGWYLERNGGSHDLYIHKDKPYKIIIGRHGKEEISKGTYYKLKKQIGF